MRLHNECTYYAILYASSYDAMISIYMMCMINLPWGYGYGSVGSNPGVKEKFK